MSKKVPNEAEIFDRRAVRLHRDRAAKELSEFEFLLAEVADMLADRLSDIRRTFPLALDLGCHSGQIAKVLDGRGGIENLIQCDGSEAMTRQAGGMRFVADEEYLPVGEELLDLAISNLSLHWVNDMPGALVQLRRALKPDGLLLATLFGGETLKELRQALVAAESELTDGAGPRVSPFADIRDAGALLQRAGFALPVADTDMLTVSYENPLKLMRDLRGMGEQMATHNRQKTFTRREVLFRAAEIYQEEFGDTDGRIPATFEVITLTAWAPAPNQQQPSARSSGQVDLAEVLGDEANED